MSLSLDKLGKANFGCCTSFRNKGVIVWVWYLKTYFWVLVLIVILERLTSLHVEEQFFIISNVPVDI